MLLDETTLYAMEERATSPPGLFTIGRRYAEGKMRLNIRNTWVRAKRCGTMVNLPLPGFTWGCASAFCGSWAHCTQGVPDKLPSARGGMRPPRLRGTASLAEKADESSWRRCVWTTCLLPPLIFVVVVERLELYFWCTICNPIFAHSPVVTLK